MLCKHRCGVIAAVMLVEGESHKDPNLFATTHTTLSQVTSHCEEEFGLDNALTAEGTVALALLGIAEGLAEDPGTFIL